MLYNYLKKDLLNKLDPSYLIIDADSFLMHDAVNQICEKCNVKSGDLDFEMFDAESFTFDKFYASVMQMPLFSEKRIVLVKNILKIDEHFKKEIIKTLSNPNPYSVVIFVDTYSSKIFSFLEKIITVVDCRKMGVLDLEKFINNYLYKMGKKLNKDAIPVLCELTNYSLLNIQNELDKLAIYTKDNQFITKEDVEKLVPKTLDYEVFEFTNALSKKQTDKALELLKDMISKKESGGLLALISSNFRRMFFALINEDQEKTAEMLKVKPFAISKAKEQAKNFSPMKLKKINTLLEEIDYKVKSGEMAINNALFYLVFEVCQ